MAREGQWDRIRQQIPSWVLSLVIHGLILAVFAMITWIVVEARRPEPVLTLGEEDVVSEAASGGGPSDSEPGAHAEPAVETKAESAAMQTAAPLPAALKAPMAESPAPGELTRLLAGATDPGPSLADALGGPGGRKGLGSGVGRFGRDIDVLRGKGLDVVVVLDATNSMAPYIEQAKTRLREVVDVITHLVPDSRFGVVAYKDYTEEYVVKQMKISADRKAVGKFIDDIAAGGGGDEPEPIHEALAVATDVRKMGWLRGRKWVVILVGDSSIHSSGRQEAFVLARNFARKRRGTINVIDVGGTADQGVRRRAVKPDLAKIAAQGGGSAFLLRDREAFWRHLVVSVFDRRFEQDVKTLIDTLVGKD